MIYRRLVVKGDMAAATRALAGLIFWWAIAKNNELARAWRGGARRRMLKFENGRVMDSLVERVGRRLIRLKCHEMPTIFWPL